MDFAPWHAHVTGHMIQARQGTRSPETEVVVTVGRSIVVAVSGTHIRRLIVERRPTQHTTSGSLPDKIYMNPISVRQAEKYSPAAHVPSNSSVVGAHG